MEGNTNGAFASIRTGAVAVMAALSFMALAMLCSPAVAQKAGRPDVKVGDQWQFVMTRDTLATELSFAWVVKSVTPAEIMATENGKALLLTPDLNVLESPRRKDSDLRLLSFPLEVGKSWAYVNEYLFKDTGTYGRGKYSVVVLTHEKVRVPAGEFDAFKLESTGSFSGTSNVGAVSGLSSRTYWYAPAARAIVKEEFRDPYRGVYGFELVEFKLQP